ncbi:MAG: heavy metal-binding domain-containing protein, partial [Lachnospiraceae bacterium]|nr:heavy metal-binding domain-containing protein [Lachnospiraceae bacterium]
MLIVTTENVSGKNLEMLGIVKGSTIQTVNAFKDIGASFKTLVGGELKNYNEMMAKARDLATQRME